MSNIILGVLDGHRLRCVDHSRFTRVIPRQTWPWPYASRARNVDKDASLALLLHVWDDHFSGVVYTLAVDQENQIEVCVGYIVGGFVPVCCSSIVYHDVARAIRFNGLLQKGFPIVEFGDICKVEGTVEVLRGCFTNFCLEVGNDDLGAFLEEFLCNAFAEALTCK